MMLAPHSGEFDPLDVVRILRSAGKPLFAQAALHGQLARIEWAEEKNRLIKMLVFALLGFASLLCVMMFLGVLVLVISWDTMYRIPAAVALVVIYGLAAGIVWRRFQNLSAQSSKAFAATREEIAADLDLLKSKL
jgi:uncharacterized membrane protein YqjE